MEIAVSKRLRGPFGVEMVGDLRTLDEADASRLRDAHDRHQLLVFRGQSLSGEQQRALMASLGLGKVTSASLEGNISNVLPDGYLGSIALPYHSDKSFSPTPEKAISLHAIDVVDGQTSTRFVNTALACASLPVALEERVRGLDVINVMSADPSRPARLIDIPATKPRRRRPIVDRHPRIGCEMIWASEAHSMQIADLDRDVSDRLLGDLFGHLYRPEHVIEHRWHVGDLLIWDNWALQHARDDLTGAGPRTLQKVVVADADLYTSLPELWGRRHENRNSSIAG